MKQYLYTLVLCMSVMPAVSHASVVINEVAWMGTAVGANDEWIELYNSGSAASLDGWVLGDGVSLEIPLTGTLGASAYGVLERTDDEVVPGTAFLIYTGALANDGRTLTLKRSDGSVEDQVVGGEGWVNIGGDNTTKDTAQRTSSGWVTGSPTPGKTNVSSGVTNDGGNNTENTGVSGTPSAAKASEGAGEKISLVAPQNELSLTLKAAKVGYVNQEMTFEVVPKGIGETLMRSLQYTWSYGDLYSDTGSLVSHVFRYPGKYAVVVSGAYGKYVAEARVEVEVLPVAVVLSRTAGGDLVIVNDTTREIDLSGYSLAGDVRMQIPKHTIILPGSSITVPAAKIESGAKKMVALYDTEAHMVASSLPVVTQVAPVHVPTYAALPQKKVAQSVEARAAPVVVLKDTTVVPEPIPEVLGTSTIVSEVSPHVVIPIGNSQRASVGDAVPSKWNIHVLSYGGLALVLIIATLLLYMRRGVHPEGKQ